MSKELGKTTAIYFAIGTLADDPELLFGSKKRFGCTRNKSMTTTWDDVDATCDDSPDHTRESMATFVGRELTWEYVSQSADLANQDEFAEHVDSPETADGQPTAWLWLVGDNRIIRGCWLISSHACEWPYDNIVTGNFSAKCIGGYQRTTL